MALTFADQFGGSTLEDIRNPTFADLQPHIENADEILFNIGRNGIKPGSLTAQEFEFVLGNPNILAKTTFVFGATF